MARETRWLVIQDDAFRPTPGIRAIATALPEKNGPKFTLEERIVLPSDDPELIKKVEDAARKLGIKLRREKK